MRRRVFINPWRKREKLPDQIKLKLIGRILEGKKYEDQPQGLLAVCFQHEIDHLEGKLLVDYISPLKREMIRKKALKSAN